MKKTKAFRYTAAFILLLSAAAVIFILSLSLGSSGIGPADVIGLITKKNNDDLARNIILNIRLPRAAAAVFLGGALSVSGFLLQTYFGNPIAGPYVLGISSGAKLMTALAMIFSMRAGILLNSAAMASAAFAGSIFSMMLILAVSGKVSNMSRLVIAGIMIGYICNSATELAVTFADDANIVNLHNWSMGSFSGIDGGDLRFAVPITAAAVTASFLLSKPMSAYRLGESYAASMGVKIKPFRITLIILSSMLSACVTAFAGPVSFVGVAVPHIVKGIFGTSEPIIIIPASFIGGGVFCMICDLFARLIFSPLELSVSTVTAIFGAPVVIYVMLHSERKRSE